MNIDAIVKLVSKIIGVVVIRIVGYGFVGVLFSLALLVAKWDAISGISLGLNHWRGVVFLLACLGIPIAFFLVGQKQGVTAAVSYLVDKRKNEIVLFIVTKFCNKYPEVLQGGGENEAFIADHLNSANQFIVGVPAIVKWVLASFIAFVGLADYVSQAIIQIRNSGDTIDNKIRRASELAAGFIDEGKYAPGYMLPCILVVISISLFFL